MAKEACRSTSASRGGILHFKVSFSSRERSSHRLNHSIMRLKLRKFFPHHFRSWFLCQRRPSRNCHAAFHSLSRDRKSLSSSFHCAWAWSAFCAASAGRSRGSMIPRPATITSISGRACSCCASSSMRPSRGSMGSRASFLPTGVSCRALSRAPISRRVR